jgi:hypothetical protein
MTPHPSDSIQFAHTTGHGSLAGATLSDVHAHDPQRSTFAIVPTTEPLVHSFCLEPDLWPTLDITLLQWTVYPPSPVDRCSG